MNGKLLITLCVLASALALISCQSPKSVPKPEDITGLDFWVTEDVSEVDFSEYHIVPGLFGGREYYGTQYVPDTDENGEQTEPPVYVKYTVTAWPDYSDGGSYVTRIVWNDPDVSIFGLTVDSSVSKITGTLSALGYDTPTGKRGVLAEKDGVSIGMYIGDDGERSLFVSVEVTNKYDLIF